MEEKAQNRTAEIKSHSRWGQWVRMEKIKVEIFPQEKIKQEGKAIEN